MIGSALPDEAAGTIAGVTWALAGLCWLLILRWEATGLTEARRHEIEVEGSEKVSPGIRAWRAMTIVVTAAVPLLFLLDGFVDGIRILYAPGLSFFAGPDLVLQIVGVVVSVIGLAILLGVGRKLAVHVYRKATHEREMMTTGVHRSIRHPFYLHFLGLPIGLFLVTLNYLSLLVFASYNMLWQPRPVTWWMRREEDDLRRRYGGAAESYLLRTGRIFPRLRRR